MKTILTLSFAKLLQLLMDRELNYSEFTPSNRNTLEQFIQDNVLDYRVIGRQHKRVFCPDKANLSRYLHNKFEIPSLNDYITLWELEDSRRSDAVRAASDSKIRDTKVLTGFLLNCYDELKCELNAEPFYIKPVTGAYTFVAAYKNFIIPADVTVIIVENHENFRDIHQQRYLFGEIRPLFVWRYQNSNAIANWLNSIPNFYIHFGDFDLKGMHIYLSEFKAKISGDHRGRFLIPPGIEVLLENYGQKVLFEGQKSVLSSILQYDLQELSSLLEIILKHKKGLSQEILIH